METGVRPADRRLEAWAETLERQMFRTLNSVARLPIQRGFGSPCIAPWGLVVLEHTGRRSGRKYASPLWAMRMGRRVLVTTYRTRRSQWIRNLKHQPKTHLWIDGKRRPVRAHVLDSSRDHGPDGMAERVDRLLQPVVRALLAAGFAVSVLQPTQRTP